MYPTPRPFTEHVKFSHRSVTVVEWTPSRFVQYQPLLWSDGSVTCDTNSTCRWTTTLQLPDMPDGLDNLGSRIRIKRGIHIPRYGDILVPWGVYRVNDINDDSTGVTVDASSLEKQIEDTRFLYARRVGGLPKGTSGAGDFDLQIVPGMNYADVIQALVLEAVPDASFDFRSESVYKPVKSFIAEQDRWSLLDGGDKDTSMAAALGVEMFFDGSGVFVVRDIPTLADQVAWVLDDEKYPVADEKTRTQTRDSLFNIVSAEGQSTDGSAPIGPAYAWDNDPTSRTYAGPDPVAHPELAGDFGVVPVFLVSGFLDSIGDCNHAATSYLHKVLGVKKTLSFKVLDNYAAEVGDVTQLDGNRYIIDSMTRSLTSSAASVDTRSSKGDLSDLQIGGV